MKFTAQIIRYCDLSAIEQKFLLVWSFLNKKLSRLAPKHIEPASLIVRAAKDDNPIAFVPVETVLIYSSVAMRPDATRADIYGVDPEIEAAIDSHAMANGIRKVLFISPASSGAFDEPIPGVKELTNVRVFERELPTFGLKFEKTEETFHGKFYNA